MKKTIFLLTALFCSAGLLSPVYAKGKTSHKKQKNPFVGSYESSFGTMENPSMHVDNKMAVQLQFRVSKDGAITGTGNLRHSYYDMQNNFFVKDIPVTLTGKVDKLQRRSSGKVTAFLSLTLSDGTTVSLTGNASRRDRSPDLRGIARNGPFSGTVCILKDSY